MFDELWSEIQDAPGEIFDISKCWEEQMTPDEYLDYIDQRNYERSNPYQ